MKPWTVILGILLLVGLGGGGYYIWWRYFSCSASVAVSAPCNKNCDCKNGACGRGTAVNNAPLVCCPSGETTTYAGYDYCKAMPDESVCWSNAMCASGFCRDNGGGFRKGKCGKGKVGDQCGINNDCANKACGRETAEDDAPLSCCKSGEVTTYGGYDYCKEMPDESVCWSNAMCASGFCRDNGGGFRKGKCGKGKVGDRCGINNDCANKACGRETAEDDAPLSCCKSGQVTTYGGFDYCKQMPDESVCWSNAMCASGYCRNNGGGTRKGKCAKATVGETCSVNNDCKNGACGRETAADNAPLQCCKSGKVTTYGGYDYCKEMPDESVCWSNAMCASGYCRDNGGGTRKGKCGKGKMGEVCGVNNDCQNQACGREGATPGTALTCCKSGQVGLYAGYDYCLQQPKGTTCWSDAQCASGVCKGNAYGIQRGTCT